MLHASHQSYCGALRSGLSALLLLTSSVALGETTSLQARFRGRDLVFLSNGSTALIQIDGGAYLTLPISIDGTYRDLAGLPGQWILSGELSQADGSSELFILYGDDEQWSRHTVPGGRRFSRTRPQLLTDERELGGLVWLEGVESGSLGVRFSRWTDHGWTAPEWISEPDTGSQLGLSALVLADGTWLAVWSAFDGQDDEVLYSSLKFGRWSPPQRISINNAVPDITPTLAPTAFGAIVAWSRYDGNDYRIRISSFDGSRWGGESWLGEAGSLFPTFLFDGGDFGAGSKLLFQTVSTSAWSVVDFGSRGQLTSRSERITEELNRPLIHNNGDSTSLEWVSILDVVADPGEPSP